MGVILNGILGGVSGKVSGVVGSNWKGINYIRGYAIPANPQTPAQQAHRAKMSLLVAVGKSLLDQVLNPYWAPLAVKMSPFNVFLSTNLKLITDDADFSNILVGKGNLSPGSMAEAFYTAGTGALATSWYGPNPDPFVNNTDTIVMVAIHKPTKQAWIKTTPYMNDGADTSMTIATDLTASDIQVYLFAFKGSGSDIEMCNSINAEAQV